MAIAAQNKQSGTIAAAVIGAAALAALAFSPTPAKAQVPYLGIDLGGGVGLGLGAPPSAYGMAPASPLWPFWGAPATYPPYGYHWQPPAYYRHW
jgi:hypothetical protein